MKRFGCAYDAVKRVQEWNPRLQVAPVRQPIRLYLMMLEYEAVAF